MLRFRAHDTVLEVTGAWCTHKQLPEGTQKALNIQFGSPPNTSLSMSLDKHLAAFLHVVPCKQMQQHLIYLEPVWCSG